MNASGFSGKRPRVPNSRPRVPSVRSNNSKIVATSPVLRTNQSGQANSSTVENKSKFRRGQSQTNNLSRSGGQNKKASAPIEQNRNRRRWVKQSSKNMGISPQNTIGNSLASRKVSNALQDRLAQQRVHLRRRRFHYLGLGFLVTIILGVMIWVGFFSSILTFDRNQVSIQGISGSITAEEIKRELSSENGKPLLRISMSGLEEKLKTKQPWIKTISVHRDFPNGLLVQIDARQPLAQTRDQKLVDKDGIVLEPGSIKISDYPLIDASCGKTQKRCYQQATACLQKLPDTFKQRMQNIQITRLNGVTIILKGNRQIIWGDASYSDQKAKVAQILLERPGNIINVTDYVHPTVKQ